MSLPVLPDLSATWKSRVFGEGDVPNQNVNGSEVITALPDTERLAFIGDAIVHLGLTNWLHERYPQHRQSLRVSRSSMSYGTICSSPPFEDETVGSFIR